MMKLLTYTYHGLMGHSKCPECGEWTPIKELNIWAGMCRSCYRNRKASNKGVENEEICEYAPDGYTNTEGWFTPSQGKYKGQLICLDWDVPCTKCQNSKEQRNR